MSSGKLQLKLTSREFLRRKKLLSKIMKFNFATRKHFNFGQKVAIARAWQKYRTELDHILERKIATFVPATKAQRKHLKDRFVRTNKGIIVYRPEGGRKPVIKGKGKTTTIIVEMIARKEIFLPYNPPPDFLTWAMIMMDNYKPERVMLAVGKHKGTQQYDLRAAKRYLERDVSPVIAYYESKGKEHPYTGLYLIILKHRKKKIK